jgi:hypothetical protein
MNHKISPRMYIPYYILYNKFAKLSKPATQILEKYEVYFGSRDCTRSISLRLRHNKDLLKLKVHLKNTDWKDHFYPIYVEGQVNEYGMLANDKELMHILTVNASGANLYDRIMSDSLRNKIGDFAQRNEMSSYMISIIHFLRNYPGSVSDDRNFTVNGRGKMTFLPANKHTELSENDNWDTKNRSEIAYGRGLRKIFSYVDHCIHDEYIEKLSNYLRGQFEFTGKFTMVFGEDVKKWYHQNTYHDNAGSLNNSCMKKPSCQEYLEIYVNNPDIVQMLIATDLDDLLIGRALVWKTQEGITFMDRIYGSDQTIQAFLEYAKEKEWHHKSNQNHSSSNHVTNHLGEKSSSKFLSVHLNTSNLDYLPYMDTFKFTDDIEDGYFNNISGEYVLENIDGSWPDESGYVTTICGTRVHEDDARWSSYHSEWYLEDDVVWSNYHDSYIEYEQCIHVNDEYYMNDADCIVHSEYEDEYLHTDDAIWSEVMEDYIYEHRAKEMIDGEWVDSEATETRLLTYTKIETNTNLSGPELNEHILKTAETYGLTIRSSSGINYIEYECYKEDYNPYDHIAAFLISSIKARISMYANTTS